MPTSASKLRILMVHWDGAGNQPPQRALARELVRRGHEVHVASHDSVAERARSDGAVFHRLPTVRQYRDTDQLGDSLGELRFLAEACWTSPAYADDVRAVADAVAPDVLIVDNMLYSAVSAAAELGRPAAVMAHSIYAPGALQGLFAAVANPAAMETYMQGSAVAASLPLVLVPSYAAFNPMPDPGPAVRHVGPIREAVETGPWPRRFPDRPLVLVSLSTSYQDQAETLQRLCDALGGLEVEALVTTGPAMPPEQFRAAPHVDLRCFVAHDEVLPSTDLVITHAGHGTVMAAAGAGVPMLCLPMGRDQPFVAARVEALGLGRVLPCTSSPDEIAVAVSQMLADPQWKSAARAFAETAPRFGDLAGAADLIEQLV